MCNYKVLMVVRERDIFPRFINNKFDKDKKKKQFVS